MKKFLSLVLALCLLMTAMPVISLAESTYREPITLTVFSEVANFAGEQGGWFAKELKDRFNVTLKFVSSNVDTNAFTTGITSGYLGDIICFGDMGEHFTTALQADLLMDLSDVDLSAYPILNEQFSAAFDKVSEYAAAQGFEGKYGFSYSVAVEDNAWAEIQDPTYALQVRFDAWEAAGKPTLASLEDLPAFAKALQEAMPTNADGEKVYAYGGFGDWEDCVMKFAWDIMTFYGYKEADFLGVNYATKDVVDPLAENSLYYRVLKVVNQMYRDGTFDPESVSQNYDTYSTKLTGGRYLIALWGWIISSYNSADKAANKDGFMTFMFEDSAPQQLTNSTSGGNRMWAIGADTEYADRALEVIEWLCTEEGAIVSNYGPQGLCWDYDENGIPVMTDFGWACYEDSSNTTMPDEYGGGTFQDGENKFNHETIKIEQYIPGKTYTYSVKGWPCYADRYATELTKAWSEEYANGATSGIDLYRTTGKASVVPAVAIAYSYPEMSDSAKESRALFAPVMKQGSWQCVYTDSDEAFEAAWNEMVTTCKSYGYDEFVAEKMTAIQACFDLY